MRRFDLALYLQACLKYKITDLTLVPPLAIALLMNDMTYEKPYLRSVRSAACGAAPLDKSVQGRLRKLLGPGTPFTQVWGMTETTCIATSFIYPETDDTGSVGRLIANLEAKYVFFFFFFPFSSFFLSFLLFFYFYLFVSVLPR
jgi:acyl-CoA synthetase (AMP-forming)/AMP-acid ligase II